MVKKIEKLNQYHEQWYYMDKINELCDAVNRMAEWEHCHGSDIRQDFREQTQEPECKHEYNSCANNERPFCGKCGRQFGDEKPAKNDELAEKYQAMFLENRKDCGFGTFKIPDYKEMSKLLADEARRWAVDVVQDELKHTTSYEFILNKLVARLKEAK